MNETSDFRPGVKTLRKRSSCLAGPIMLGAAMTASAAFGEAAASGRIARHEVTVNASVEDVWRAWTTVDGVTSFGPPKAWIDLRIGGPYEWYFLLDAPEGQRGCEGCMIFSYVPQEMLAFTWNAPPSIPALRNANAQTQVVVRLEDLGNGQVQVVLTQSGFGEGDDWEKYYAYFQVAWDRVLAGLKNALEASPAASATTVGNGVADPASTRGASCGEHEMPRMLLKEVTVNASLDDAWWAWTTSAGIAAFFSPESNIDVRVGGPYELFMRGDPNAPGKRGTQGCKVLAYVPKEMLSFEWNFPPKVVTLREVDAKTHVVLRFEPVGQHRVKVRFAQLGWQEGADWDAGYAYFDQAWDWVFDRFTKYFAEGSSDSVDARTAGNDPPADITPADDTKTWVDGGVTVTARYRPAKRQDFEIVIPVAVEEVWRAIATSEGMRKYLGHPANIDLRPGGAYAYWPGANNKVLSYRPMEMLAITGSAPPQFPNAQKGGTTGVFLLDDLGAGGTRLRVVSLGWHEHEGEEWDRAFDYFLRNNPRYLKTLHDKLVVFNKPAGGDRILTWTADVDAPVSEVWKAFTTKDGIESWMVPVAEVDLRRGGFIRTNYNPSAKIGEPGTITHVILAYEPEKMISSRFIAPENAPAAKVAEAAWGVSYFEEIEPQRTRVTYKSCGWGQGPDWEAAERFFEEGNTWTFERLRRKFAPGGAE